HATKKDRRWHYGGRPRTLHAELARGCSHIRSALTHATRTRAIVEVLDEFRKLNGDSELPVFQRLLAEELRRQGSEEAASAVQDFKTLC
ncbi:hypothetical protein PQR70_42990, partial [Paraburkholderia madseniana]|uniref:hypothetical protein n=1 Tax=Paraburkholderia madseniana TaxID=2599607 RepID=UPI0038B95FB4